MKSSRVWGYNLIVRFIKKFTTHGTLTLLPENSERVVVSVCYIQERPNELKSYCKNNFLG
jgi:hypothetical protein